MNAIKNGKYDIREGHPFPDIKNEGLNNTGANSSFQKDVESIENQREVKDKKNVNNMEEKFPENEQIKEINNGGIIPSYVTNDIVKQAPEVTIPISNEKDNVKTALLDDTIIVTPERYPISEIVQFWIVLKRALLFSRRDWVSYKDGQKKRKEK